MQPPYRKIRRFHPKKLLSESHQRRATRHKCIRGSKNGVVHKEAQRGSCAAQLVHLARICPPALAKTEGKQELDRPTGLL